MAMRGARRVSGVFVRATLGACVVLLLAGAPTTSRALAKNAKAATKNQDARWGVVEHVGHGVTAPVPVYAPESTFPKGVSPANEMRGVTCSVEIIVDREGRPEDARVVRSGGKAVDAKAMESVKQYRFKPAMQGGKPVAVRVVVHMLFKKY